MRLTDIIHNVEAASIPRIIRSKLDKCSVTSRCHRNRKVSPTEAPPHRTNSIIISHLDQQKIKSQLHHKKYTRTVHNIKSVIENDLNIIELIVHEITVVLYLLVRDKRKCVVYRL